MVRVYIVWALVLLFSRLCGSERPRGKDAPRKTGLASLAVDTHGSLAVDTHGRQRLERKKKASVQPPLLTSTDTTALAEGAQASNATESSAGTCGCWTTKQTGGIAGKELAKDQTCNIGVCTEKCCNDPKCEAMAFSPDADADNCKLYEDRSAYDESVAQEAGFLVHLLARENWCGCWLDHKKGSMPGLGFKQVVVKTVDDCQGQCCGSEKCEAIQFSPAKAAAGTDSCFLYEHKTMYNANAATVEDYIPLVLDQRASSLLAPPTPDGSAAAAAEPAGEAA